MALQTVEWRMSRFIRDWMNYELERAEGYLVTVIVKMEYCLPRRFRAGVKKEWKKI